MLDIIIGILELKEGFDSVSFFIDGLRVLHEERKEWSNKLINNFVIW